MACRMPANAKTYLAQDISRSMEMHARRVRLHGDMTKALSTKFIPAPRKKKKKPRRRGKAAKEPTRTSSTKREKRLLAPVSKLLLHRLLPSALHDDSYACHRARATAFARHVANLDGDAKSAGDSTANSPPSTSGMCLPPSPGK